MDSVEYKLLFREQGKSSNSKKFFNAETDEEAIKLAEKHAKNKNAEIQTLIKTVQTITVLIRND